jgi:hypothetical protein
MSCACPAVMRIRLSRSAMFAVSCASWACRCESWRGFCEGVVLTREVGVWERGRLDILCVAVLFGVRRLDWVAMCIRCFVDCICWGRTRRWGDVMALPRRNGAWRSGSLHHSSPIYFVHHDDCSYPLTRQTVSTQDISDQDGDPTSCPPVDHDRCRRSRYYGRNDLWSATQERRGCHTGTSSFLNVSVEGNVRR